MTTAIGKSRVLIVDDEEAICKLISRLLEQEGFVPLVALDGKTALQQLRTASPDTMIVDLQVAGFGRAGNPAAGQSPGRGSAGGDFDGPCESPRGGGGDAGGGFRLSGQTLRP